MIGVETGRTMQPPRLLVYGVPGVGKTTLGAEAPNAIFQPTEEGAELVGVDRFSMAISWERVLENIEKLRTEDHDYQTYVLDTLDCAEPLNHASICRSFKVAAIGDLEFGKGYAAAQELWRGLLAALDRLRREKQMGILLLAHAETKRVHEPDLPELDRWVLPMNNRSSSIITGWCDFVGFSTFRTTTREEKANFGATRTRAISSGERIIKTSMRPSHIAKTRYPMADEIALSWSSLSQAIAGEQKNAA